MKKVLIAHQSTIPHYRVPFYNALQKCKPDDWSFEVVFDPAELTKNRFFKEQLDTDFNFPTLEVKTITLSLNGKNISYQTFWCKAAEYNLIIIEQALNNLSYPLCHLHQLGGTKLAYWGHGKHQGAKTDTSMLKHLSEKLKTTLTNRADAFFAYTPRGKFLVEEQGFAEDKIFAVNNTVDIKTQRQAFDKCHRHRKKIRQLLGINDKKVLLFVGRFSKTKRIDLLLEAFSMMRQQDKSFHLLLVGSGGEEYWRSQPPGVSYFGSITELEKLAPIYVAADVFSFPGSVGLGPVQALCYDLPIVTIDSEIHPPEFEYLSPENSCILPADTQAQEYAQFMMELFGDRHKLDWLRSNTWSTIKHLTIEQMAQNFALGINSILN